MTRKRLCLAFEQPPDNMPLPFGEDVNRTYFWCYFSPSTAATVTLRAHRYLESLSAPDTFLDVVFLVRLKSGEATLPLLRRLSAPTDEGMQHGKFVENDAGRLYGLLQRAMAAFPSPHFTIAINGLPCGFYIQSQFVLLVSTVSSRPRGRATLRASCASPSRLGGPIPVLCAGLKRRRLACIYGADGLISFVMG